MSKPDVYRKRMSPKSERYTDSSRPRDNRPAHRERHGIHLDRPTTVHYFIGTSPVTNVMAGIWPPESVTPEIDIVNTTQDNGTVIFTSTPKTGAVENRHGNGKEDGSHPRQRKRRRSLINFLTDAVTDKKRSLTETSGGGGGKEDKPWREAYQEYPENKYIAKMEALGIPVRVPGRFLDKSKFTKDTLIDKLTGLPVQEGEFRMQLGWEFSQTIRNNKGFVMIYADADQLKLANSRYGHQFGNSVIMNGVAHPTQLIDELALPETVSMYAARQTGNADELAIWIFNLEPKQVERIQEQMKRSSETREFVVDPEDDDSKFTLSVTTRTHTSLDENLQGQLDKSRQYLTKNPNKIDFNLFESLNVRGEDDTRMMKIAKDISRLDIEKLGKHRFSKEIKEILIRATVDTRINEPLQRTVFAILQESVIADLFPEEVNHDRIIRHLSDFYGRPREWLEEYYEDDVHLRIAYYDSILHNTYERLGFGEIHDQPHN